MTKKIAIVLSGCGHLDGSEITEAVSSIIALSDLGCEIECFAPSIDFATVDHQSKTETGERRNALKESARISRGHVRPLEELMEPDFDGIVFPGGFGAAKNLSTWAAAGSKGTFNKEVTRVIRHFHKSAKPIGAICIAPVLVARVLGEHGVTVTIGDDRSTAEEIIKTGAQHATCNVTDYVSDRDHKVLTTPAYMFDHAKPHEVFQGIRRMLTELVEMA